MDEEGRVIQKRRDLPGTWRTVERAFLCLISILGAVYALGIPGYFRLAFFVEQYAGLLFGMMVFALFLSTKAFRRSRDRTPPVLDVLFAIAGLASGLYIAVFYPTIVFRSGFITMPNLVFGLAALVLVLEGTRRTSGWVLVIVTLVMAAIALFSGSLPGIFKISSVAWDRLVNYLYLDTNALFGLPLTVTLDMVLPFILFGSFLFAMGGGEFFVDMALALFGRYRGGPAKVSVVASGCFGTISGSAVANVMVDGWITIPMMVRVGYRPHVAAAIEAIASTGGQLMPPVMGLTAFLIAEFLNAPYAQVALAAAIPAVLYYLCIFVQIDREAAQHGIKGLPPSEIPHIGSVVRRGWIFVVPLALLIYALFFLNLQPGKAGMYAVLATLAIALLGKDTRSRLAKSGISILENAGRTIVELGMITAVAGLIIGLASVSGLGSLLSIEIVRYGGHNTLVLLLLTAGVSLILGMGMPTAAAYILLAITVIPSVVQGGITPMAAHLFIFYFGAISMITPPVAIAAFAAASIIGTSPMRTGYAAFRLGILAYLVPFIFVYSHELIMIGPPWRIALAFVT
ncbi:MAG: TRAP transporter fused permease subunit, partial [Candidatus Tectomicrobia bacterium]|nr:TRAP transporter fused permease subunit [Candidatus Tectomicrobia bacterium]